jgi:hypothetical protein
MKRKTVITALITLIIWLTFLISLFAQPYGNGQGQGPDKDTPCPPGNPHCNSVPIDTELLLIIGGAAGFILKKLFKHKKI